MEDDAAVRGAALDAIDDIDPEPLRERIATQLTEGSMAPGVLTIRTVRALDDGTSTLVTSDGILRDPVAERVAGVQLIYDGLRLTRQLAHDEPWVDGDRETADLAVLAADVLVSRGFYLLARTEAAEAAVGVVRAFGSDQTVRRETDDHSLDRNLEADVLELAVVAGASMGDGTASPRMREFAAGMVNGEPFGDPDAFFPDTLSETLGSMAAETGGSPGVTTSADR
jgi:hypothetical protein